MTKAIKKSCRLVFSIGRKFASRPSEALLLCRMAWWVGVISVAARYYSLPRALQIVAGQRYKRKAAKDVVGIQKQLARTIDLLLSTDAFIFKPSCWKRAAVLHRYLARNGTATRIVFGVRDESGGKVAGHAWLEVEGEPILESLPPNYVVTYSFPSNERFDPKLTSIALE